MLGFGRPEDSARITIRNIDFSNARASGTIESLKFVHSTFSRVMNSSFDRSSDLLLLQDVSNFNAVQGNAFGRASHSLISVRSSSNNVICDNEFENPRQKAMEISDCEGISDAPARLDATKRNLIETNRFYGTAPAGQSHYFNAIQQSGQRTIVRYNTFANDRGGGVNFRSYADESIFVFGNRLYNNTFYNYDCYAIIGQSGRGNHFFDNRVVNNLLVQNRT